MQITEDYKEFFALLNTHKVRYMVVGAYAMALHDQPRATSDIDILVEATPENARRVMAALSDFGFGNVGLSADDFCTPRRTVQLGYPPKRIDLLTSIDGVSFGEAAPRCLQGDYDGIPVPFLGLEDMIRNKEAAGRDKDLLDAKILRKRLKK